MRTITKALATGQNRTASYKPSGQDRSQTATRPQVYECGTATEVDCDKSRRARRVIWCLVGRAAAMVRQAKHFIPSLLDFYQQT